MEAQLCEYDREYHALLLGKKSVSVLRFPSVKCYNQIFRNDCSSFRDHRWKFPSLAYSSLYFHRSEDSLVKLTIVVAKK